MSRRLAKFEELGWRSERGYTLNFTTVAHLTAPPSAQELRIGLKQLVARHPNLARGVDGPATREPSLVEEDAPIEAWRATVSAELAHGSWQRGDAPIRVRVLRHSNGAALILLTLYHPYSDGKSGMLAMRDLLAFTARPDERVEPLDTSPLELFLPAAAARRPLRRYFARQQHASSMGRPAVWREGACGPPESRVPHIAPVVCDRTLTAALIAGAKAEGVSLHAVLSAALACGWAEASGRTGDVSISFHPVDMRAYLSAWAKREGVADPRIPETIGYYVSLIDVALRLSHTDLWADARAFHDVIQTGKREGVPLFTASAAASLMRILQRMLGVRGSRALIEGPMATTQFALSNLGALERLGLEAGGEFGLRSVHFVGAPSVTSNVCASAVGFDGAVHMNILSVEPSLHASAAQAIAEATAHALQRAID